MPITVNTNVASLNAQNTLTRNTNAVNKSLERLSSGYRINRASDDAAGLQLSEILRGQIRGLDKALSNTQDAKGVLNIMDGAMNTITNNLQRMRELTVQAANDTNTTAQRVAIEQEVGQLADEITRIANQTQFNSRNLINGSVTAFTVQVGANSSETLELVALVTGVDIFSNISAGQLSVSNLVYSNVQGSVITSLLGTIDNAISTVNQKRGAIGAISNRLDSVSENLMYAIENNSAAESRIRDLDVARESANLVRNQILQQASASILSQANQSPGIALSLL